MEENGLYIIKFYDNNKFLGFFDCDKWDWTSYFDDAEIFTDVSEAKRIAKRFCDKFDSDCNVTWSIFKLRIEEIRIESGR